MKTRDYREILMHDLQNVDFAAEYLTACFEEGCKETFLTAVRDVVEALGGVSQVAKETGLGRTNMYKMLDKNGNPTLSSLMSILGKAGLGISFYKK
ncbi:MAG: transcriptional regulator [Bdellovibrionota bacterium]